MAKFRNHDKGKQKLNSTNNSLDELIRVRHGNCRRVLKYDLLGFPVERDTRQVSTQSFEVKTLTFPMATSTCSQLIFKTVLSSTN